MSILWEERGVFRSEEGLRDTAYNRMISCSGKAAFRNIADAMQQLRDLDETARQSVYKCKHCSFWHTGHYYRPRRLRARPKGSRKFLKQWLRQLCAGFENR